MMLTTTLNAIREHDPCADGWKKLLAYLGKNEADDEALALATILESNGLADATWALRAVTGHDGAIRHFAVWCARQVRHLMEDPRSVAALGVAERHADGLATDEELAAAWDAAWDAARDVAGGAARAAARNAAWDAAWTAARVAARVAAKGATWTAAGDAAWDAAWTAARVAARDAQAVEFRRRFCTEDV